MHASRNGGTIMGKYGTSGGVGGGLNPGFRLSVDEEIGEVLVHILHRPGGSAEVIVAIEFVSRQGQIHRFGGDRDADERISFPLDPGDVISKITGMSHDFVTSVRIWLKSGRDSGLLGSSVGINDFEYDGGSQQIVGLWGRTGAWIDAIGIYSE